MDEVTLSLFGKTPREIGNPYRWQINSIEEIEHFTQNNNGIHNCFVSIYPSNFLIDKIFFDYDYGKRVLGDAQETVEWMLDRKYEVIPLASGDKGFHLYMKTKPTIYGNQSKIFLTRATFAIIKEIFGEVKSERIKLGNKKVRILRNKDRIIAPDPKVIGDIKRLGRIPNTFRPPGNCNYCTYLPPEEFLNMTERDIAKHIKSTHTYPLSDYQKENKIYPLLTDFEYDFVDEIEHEDWLPFLSDRTIPSNPNLFLEGILRPCLYKNICTIHPDHDVRLATTIDLLRAKYDESFILNLYSTLGWEDFEEEETLLQIKSCIEHKDNGILKLKYERYSCSKLRELKIPEVCCIG